MSILGVVITIIYYFYRVYIEYIYERGQKDTWDTIFKDLYIKNEK